MYIKEKAIIKNRFPYILKDKEVIIEKSYIKASIVDFSNVNSLICNNSMLEPQSTIYFPPKNSTKLNDCTINTHNKYYNLFNDMDNIFYVDDIVLNIKESYIVAKEIDLYDVHFFSCDKSLLEAENIYLPHKENTILTDSCIIKGEVYYNKSQLSYDFEL